MVKVDHFLGNISFFGISRTAFAILVFLQNVENTRKTLQNVPLMFPDFQRF